MEVVDVLKQIDSSIAALSKRNDLTSFFPLVVAFISAVTAIAATKASVWFSSRRLELNCARALYSETEIIDAEIKLAIDAEKQTNFVRASFLSAPDRICPVYRGAATNIGLLDLRVAKALIEFYSSLLTLQPLKRDGEDMKDAFSKQTLEAIRMKSQFALAAIRNRYGAQVAS